MHQMFRYLGLPLAALLLVGCGVSEAALGERAQEARATAGALVDIPAPDANPSVAPPTQSTLAPSAQPPNAAEPSGAAQRVESTAAPAAPSPAPPDLTGLTIVFEPVAEGLDLPVALANAGDGSGRLFVVEKQGWIAIVREGQLVPEPFLDIRELVLSSGSEQGLLGLAFHPQYAQNGRFFVAYTDRDGRQGVARYQASENPDRADPASAVALLVMDDPAANHNGGGLAFGPDGYLYVGTGDGGRAGDPWNNAQNPDTLLGKMLRLDVDGGEPYAIPADNPFVEAEGVRPEIWASGLRNPWRFSFDRASGDLYIADVGQNAFEEINRQPASSRGGENYGWKRLEGTHCFEPRQGCAADGTTLPVKDYAHDLGCSVTGGYVYRGERHPGMQGAYIFADFCSGLLFGLTPPAGGPDASGDWTMTTLAETGLRITSFGEDESGEIYLVGLGHSTLYRISLG
jgi:glucose/arabinose dehydrogenase